MKSAQKSDFSQLCLEQTQTESLPDRYYASSVFLWISLGFKSISYHFRNEQVMYQGALLFVGDNFILKGPKELLWVV